MLVALGFPSRGFPAPCMIAITERGASAPPALSAATMLPKPVCWQAHKGLEWPLRMKDVEYQDLFVISSPK